MIPRIHPELVTTIGQFLVDTHDQKPVVIRTIRDYVLLRLHLDLDIIVITTMWPYRSDFTGKKPRTNTTLVERRGRRTLEMSLTLGPDDTEIRPDTVVDDVAYVTPRTVPDTHDGRWFVNRGDVFVNFWRLDKEKKRKEQRWSGAWELTLQGRFGPVRANPACIAFRREREDDKHDWPRRLLPACDLCYTKPERAHEFASKSGIDLHCPGHQYGLDIAPGTTPDDDLF